MGGAWWTGRLIRLRPGRPNDRKTKSKQLKYLTPLAAAALAAAVLTSPLAWAKPDQGASPEWEHGSWQIENLGIDVPCRGEKMDFFGEVPYKIHRVSKPGGGYSQKLQILPITPSSPPFVAVSHASGKVFHFQNGLPYNEIIHLGPNEVSGGQAREVYVADDGERLIVRFQWRLVINANGDVVLDRFNHEFVCDE